MGLIQDEKMTGLMNSDPAFKAMVEEHRILDEQLHEIDKKVYLSPDEEIERKRLQKLKLAKKDQIVAIMGSTH